MTVMRCVAVQNLGEESAPLGTQGNDPGREIRKTLAVQKSAIDQWMNSKAVGQDADLNLMAVQAQIKYHINKPPVSADRRISMKRIRFQQGTLRLEERANGNRCLGVPLV